MVDLRVDDHPDPLRELARLNDLQVLYFGSSPPGEKLRVEGDLLRELKAVMLKTGHFAGAVDDKWNADVEKALDAFVGVENLEERMDLAGRTIDPPALTYIRDRFG